MPFASSLPVRVARSAGAGVVCSATAAVAHTAGGGTTSPGVVLGLLISTALVAGVLAGRRIATGQFIGLLVLAQVVLHVASPDSAMPHGPGMVLLHVAATAASAALLTHGEAFAWRLVTRLTLRALPSARRVPVLPRVRPVTRTPRVLVPCAVVVDRGMRGPPVGIA